MHRLLPALTHRALGAFRSGQIYQPQAGGTADIAVVIDSVAGGSLCRRHNGELTNGVRTTRHGIDPIGRRATARLGERNLLPTIVQRSDRVSDHGVASVVVVRAAGAATQ